MMIKLKANFCVLFVLLCNSVVGIIANSSDWKSVPSVPLKYRIDSETIAAPIEDSEELPLPVVKIVEVEKNNESTEQKGPFLQRDANFPEQKMDSDKQGKAKLYSLINNPSKNRKPFYEKLKSTCKGIVSDVTTTVKNIFKSNETATRNVAEQKLEPQLKKKSGMLGLIDIMGLNVMQTFHNLLGNSSKNLSPLSRREMSKYCAEIGMDCKLIENKLVQDKLLKEEVEICVKKMHDLRNDDYELSLRRKNFLSQNVRKIVEHIAETSFKRKYKIVVEEQQTKKDFPSDEYNRFHFD